MVNKLLKYVNELFMMYKKHEQKFFVAWLLVYVILIHILFVYFMVDNKRKFDTINKLKKETKTLKDKK